jgi:hypothetical protein
MKKAILSVMIVFATVQAAQAEPKAIVIPLGFPSEHLDLDTGASCSGGGDGMQLVVTDERRTLLRKNYCSDYGGGGADIVTDNKGLTYLFLQAGVGHGTEVNQTYLFIFRLQTEPGTLRLIKKVELSRWVGPETIAIYKYSVSKPADGGLRLVLKRRIEGNKIYATALPKEMVVDIDRGT